MSLLAEVGKGLAGQWAQRALAPAAVFWAGGLAAWADRHGWNALLGLWPAEAAEQVGVLALGLGLVAGSGALLETLAPTLLRLAEGYWPWPLRRLRFPISRRLAQRMEPESERWGELYERQQELQQEGRSLEPHELDELVRLDLAQARFPVEPHRAMPTSVGNRLRAAEDHPRLRYGLDAAVCWPRLWLLLPDAVREELGGARGRLDQATLLCAWGLLFLVFAGWSAWAVPAGLAVSWVAWRTMELRATAFGELLRAAFDVHRTDLYDALRLPRPTDPATEPEHGAVVTEYLFRGTADAILRFADASADEERSDEGRSAPR